jgi:hypothetical protein
MGEPRTPAVGLPSDGQAAIAILAGTASEPRCT